MRILLVRPPRMKQAITLGEFMYSEPIGLEMLHTVFSVKHDVEIIDLMVDDIRQFRDECNSKRPDVVGITTLCVDTFQAIELLVYTKELNKNIITLVGGTQPNVNPEAFFHKAIDHIFQITTKENLQNFSNCLESGRVIPKIPGIRSKTYNYEPAGKIRRNEYIIPNRQSTEKYRHHYSYFGYKPCAIMQTSQGCSSLCNFCLRWRIEGAKEYDFPLTTVIDEIKRIKEPNIMIYDNDFLQNGPRLNRFCEELEKHNIQKTFICYGSVMGILTNKKAIARFAKNGLKAVLVGYETFADDELSSYNKNVTTEENIIAGKLLKKWKVDCWASFMLHPDWSRKDFQKLRRYILRLKPEISTFSPLTPFPNLPLFKQYKDRLIVHKDDYHFWSFGQVVIYPKQMSLRWYLWETLLTSLFINSFTNNAMYLVKKFKYSTIYKITIGSSRLVRLMLVMILKGENYYREFSLAKKKNM